MVITECQLYYYVLIINILALFLFNILVFQNTYVIFVVIVQNKMKQNKMKSKNIILLFTLALPLFSCSESQKRVSFSESTTAKSTALKEAFISIPMDIKKKGDILYAGDFKGDSLLYCYSLSEQRFVNQMLPQGQGPDEFLSPVEFFLSDSSAFIHNRWHFTAQNYIFNTKDFSIQRQGELIHLPMSIDRVYPISESRFIASGVFEDCRFLILDNDGNVISKCGDFPNYQSGEENIPNTAKGMFHQSQFGYNTDRKRLACATSNVLELWDYKPETLTLHKRLLLAPYHYQFNSSPDGVYAESDNPDAELGARGIAVSNNYVYVLYNPNTNRMHEEQKETLNSEIWVFDWEGKPIRKILPDTHIECFCVDETDTSFYCVMTAPDYCIGIVSPSH